MSVTSKDNSQEKYYQELKELLMGVRTKKQIDDFLQGFFTPQELEQLVLRLQIVKRLKAKQPQRQIAQELGVGIATVTRGSRELRRGHFNMVRIDAN